MQARETTTCCGDTLMTTNERFADVLEETAEIFKPLIVSAPMGARIWNGKEFAPSAVERIADPTAMMWWGILKVMAGLIRAQTTPLSSAQLEVIRRELFGGMSSFQDLSFNERQTHGLPRDTNARLSSAVKSLHESFHGLRTAT
jgi:hypothetical protein